MNNLIHNSALRKKFDRAIRLNKEGRISEAISVLELLRKQFPESASVAGYLGGIYFEQAQFSRATASFRKALQFSPASELASVGLFHSLWAAGKTDQALDEMARFLSLAESREYRTLIHELHLKPVIRIQQLAMAS